jgi:hypothetical protein
MRSNGVRRQLTGALVLAAGILGGTALAVATRDRGWWVLSGPIALALSFVVVAWSRPGRRASAPAAWILAAAAIGSAVLVAAKDPEIVALLLPIVGAGGFVLLDTSWASRREGCASGRVDRGG